MLATFSKILLVFIFTSLCFMAGCNKKNPNEIHSYNKTSTYEDNLKKNIDTMYIFRNYNKIFLMKKEKYFSDTVCFYTDLYDSRIFFIHDKKIIWLHEDEYFIDYLKRVKQYIVWNQIDQKNIGKFFWYIINGYGGGPTKGEFIKNNLSKLWKLSTEFHSRIYPDSLIYMQFKTFELKTRTKHKEEFFYFFKNDRLELRKLTTDTLKESEIQTIE